MIDGLYAYIPVDEDNMTFQFIDGVASATLFSIVNNALVAYDSGLVANIDPGVYFENLYFNSASWMAENGDAGADCYIDGNQDLSCSYSDTNTLVWCDDQGTISLSQGVPSGCTAAVLNVIAAGS